MRRLWIVLGLVWLLPACSTIQGVDTAIAGSPPAHLRGDIALTVKFVDPSRLADECARALRMAGRLSVPVHECVYAEAPGEPIVMVVSNPCRVRNPNHREAIECHAIGHAHQIRHGLPVEEWWFQSASAAESARTIDKPQLYDRYYQDALLQPATARIPSPIKAEDAVREAREWAAKAEQPAALDKPAPQQLAAASADPLKPALKSQQADAPSTPAAQALERALQLAQARARAQAPDLGGGEDEPARRAEPKKDDAAGEAEPKRFAEIADAADRAAEAAMVGFKGHAKPRPTGTTQTQVQRSLGESLSALIEPLGDTFNRLFRREAAVRSRTYRGGDFGLPQ